MKKIKITITIIIALLITLFSTNVFAVNFESNGENKKRDLLFEDTLANYMQQYQKEDTPEEKRINSYLMNGFGISNETDEILAVSITFIVEPYSKENTIWENSKEDINNGNYICFAKYKKVNGDYELERVSEIPENYDEFLKKFEEYKVNNPNPIKENVSIQGKQDKASSSEKIINNISTIIYLSCLVICIISLIFIIKFRKRKNNLESQD